MPSRKFLRSYAPVYFLIILGVLILSPVFWVLNRAFAQGGPSAPTSSFQMGSTRVPQVAAKLQRPLRLTWERYPLSPKMRAMAFSPAGINMDGHYVVPDNRIHVTGVGKFTNGASFSGPNATWTVHRSWWRARPGQPWQAVSGSEWKAPLQVETPTFESSQKVTVSVVPFPPHGGEWKVQATMTMWVQSLTTGELWRADLPLTHQIFASLPADGTSLQSKAVRYLHLPPPSVTRLRIAKLQYRLADFTWVDAPRPGDANYPLKLPSFNYVTIRAVSSQPDKMWPKASGDSADYFPKWRLELEGKPVKEEFSFLWNGEAPLSSLDARKRGRAAKCRFTAIAGNSVSLDIVFNAEHIVIPEPPVPKNAKGPWVMTWRYSIGGANFNNRPPGIGEKGFPMRIPANAKVYFRSILRPYKKGQKLGPGEVLIPKYLSKRHWLKDNTYRESKVPDEMLLVDLEEKSEDYDGSAVGQIYSVRLFEKENEEGAALKTAIQLMPIDKKTPAPPVIPPVRFRKFQIKSPANNTWRDIPFPGEPGYPLAISNTQGYRVRLDVTNPVNWDMYRDLGYERPQWQFGYAGDAPSFERNEFEISVYARRLPANAKELYKLSVTGPTTFNTHLKVVPDYISDTQTYQQNVQGLTARLQILDRNLSGIRGLPTVENMALQKYQSEQGQATVNIILNNAGVREFPVTARFYARHPDGKPAGKFSDPESGTLFRSGTFSTQFSSDNRAGLVNVGADLLGPKGEVIKRLPSTTIRFDDLKAGVYYGKWAASLGQPDTWERIIYPLARWRHPPVRLTPALGAPVNLAVRHVDAGSRGSSWLEKPSGHSTVPPGPGGTALWAGAAKPTRQGIKQFWKWSPTANRDLDAYQVDASFKIGKGGK